MTVAEYDAGMDFDLQRVHGRKLGLGEAADVVLAVIGVANQLLGQLRNDRSHLRGAEFEAGRIPFVELAAVLPHGVHAVAL
jgi:hypothetical protein